MLEFSIVIQLCDQKIRIVELIDPLGNLLLRVPDALACNSIDHDSTVNVLAVPPADAVGDGRRDPVGGSAVVNLEGNGLKYLRRIVEADVAVDIAEEIFAWGIFHAAVQPHQVGLLGHHVNGQVGRQSLLMVKQPFDGICIPERRHAVGSAIIIDLGVIVLNLKLGD